MRRLGALLLLIIAQVLPTQAFNVQENWVGNELRWEDSDLPIEWITDSGNAAIGGARWDAIRLAVDQWNRTGGLRLLFTLSNPQETDNTMTDGDGKSEVLYTTRATIDGVAGRERTTRTCPSCRRIIESDVAIANDVAPLPNPPTDAFGGCSAEAVLIHEFGHTIGLDHENGRLAMMQDICNNTPRVLGQPAGTMVLPDDQQGARQQYSGNGDEVNLIAVPQYLFRELPVLFRDRITALTGAGIIAAANFPVRLVNFGRAGTPRAFNPDLLECAFLGGIDPGCEGSFYDVNAPNQPLMMCPGDSMNVPWTVASRTNSGGSERAHSMGFYLTDDATVPFDPTSEFLIDLPLAGAFLDNEIEIDSTGQRNLTGVERLTLSDDPDCALAGTYRLWHGVDICHEHLEGSGTVAAGGAFEEDNFALTGLFVTILDPGAAQCAGAAIPASDGVCPLSEIRKTCDAPPLPDPDGEPQPPDDCDPGEEACICQTVVGGLGDPDGHPDGNHAFNEFCPDDEGERVCLSQGGFGLCETCNAPNDRQPGCSCTADDQCGADLTCFGEETQNGSGIGTCQPDSPPSWTCLADCQQLFNDPNAFCDNNHPSGTALCVPGVCNGPDILACWTEGELLGVDDQPTFGPFCGVAPDASPLSRSCQSQCGPGADLDNPDLDVSCQDIGYPPNFECDLQVAGGACRPGPL
ncbi:matrixin family metalloprotease [uncultured Tateyamaria sp.]|uniref:matrixin family metalloprotease n=1 Tax=uncultured Tateyamaria sp. TaxID=455651 RepID=UPI0026256108|nr:matrixin family metalloprotease [uncultured Tateyamaria sp.]